MVRGGIKSRKGRTILKGGENVKEYDKCKKCETGKKTEERKKKGAKGVTV